MAVAQYSFGYEVFDDSSSLNEDDRQLLSRARDAAMNAHAPYSRFRVGAAARLANGEVVTGANQENASYPAGICAEGTTLSVASSLFPGMPISTLAITYKSEEGKSDHPVAPCGICRQQLEEFRMRTGSPVRLIMTGETGQVIVVEDASMLMPFSFRF